jgi:predicted membrane GTPase involved in stress response
MATPNLLLSDMRLIRANPDLTKEVLRMAGKQSLYEKQLERIAKAVGPDLISFLNKDELLEQIPPEVRVRGLTLEERLRGLNLDAETLEKLKELINGQDGVSS